MFLRAPAHRQSNRAWWVPRWQETRRRYMGVLPVFELCVADDGTVYVGTSNGLAVLDPAMSAERIASDAYNNMGVDTAPGQPQR